MALTDSDDPNDLGVILCRAGMFIVASDDVIMCDPECLTHVWSFLKDAEASDDAP